MFSLRHPGLSACAMTAVLLLPLTTHAEGGFVSVQG